jgi:hypothetical protein
MVCLRCLVCSLVCVTLVIVAPIPVLPTILVTLLRACTEMLRTRATVSTSHCTGVSHLLILCWLTDIRMTYLDHLADLG